jgi:predicted phage baseplate assembly protein
LPLTAPDLDVRKFQDIVDDVKRQIGLRCPEWTDHNVSDPGVTLIELFAYMTEMMLFRLNQVPERNYIKFLELIGLSLEMPQPAETDLRLMLSTPIWDNSDFDSFEVSCAARTTVASTLRTETEEALEFSTDLPLVLGRPRTAYALALPPVEEGGDGSVPLASIRTFVLDTEPLDAAAAFPVYGSMRGERPKPGDTFCLGFEGPVAGHLLEFVMECNAAAATGMDSEAPLQVWEYWAGSTWKRVEVIADGSKGFSQDGGIQLAIAHDFQRCVLGGKSAFWVRCRYTIDVDELPVPLETQDRPLNVRELAVVPYTASPEIMSLRVRTIGGTVPASNCAQITSEILGRSDGTPGQKFALTHSPLLQLSSDEIVLSGELNADPTDMTNWVAWKRVDDFSQSSPDDRHFVCDPVAGEVLFGPQIEQNDGKPPRRYGAIPPARHTIAINAYRIGGGSMGNVRPRKIAYLKSDLPYIREVFNPRPAIGGRDRETLDRAKLRALEILKIRDRAVTSEDYEYLACRASTAVGRAKCIQPLGVGEMEGQLLPGRVRVLVVPALSEAALVPRPLELRTPARIKQAVGTFLRERSLLTVSLDIAEPEYVFVSAHLAIVTDPRHQAETVARRVHDCLNGFIHPLRGGFDGAGWPFGRALTLSDIYAQVGDIPGVAFLTDARIYTSTVSNPEDGILGQETVVTAPEGIRLLQHQVLCSRQHNIKVVQIDQIGSDTAATKVER